MTNLNIFRERYFEILRNEEPMCTNRLVNLMADMETTYSIPMRRKATFESNNPAVMHLYRLVSKSRNMEGVR